MEVGVGGEVCEGWFVVTGPTYCHICNMYEPCP